MFMLRSDAKHLSVKLFQEKLLNFPEDVIDFFKKIKILNQGF